MGFIKEECLIAYETPSGEYMTIKCFNDGTINGVGKMLSERYNDSISAKKIVSMGNLENLGVTLQSEDYIENRGKAKYYDVCGEFLRETCEKAKTPTEPQKLSLLDIYNHLYTNRNEKNPNKQKGVNDVYIYAGNTCWLHRYVKGDQFCVQSLKDEVNKTFSKAELEKYNHELNNLDKLESQALDFLCYDAFGETYNQIAKQLSEPQNCSTDEYNKTDAHELDTANDLIKKQNNKLSTLILDKNMNYLKLKDNNTMER